MKQLFRALPAVLLCLCVLWGCASPEAGTSQAPASLPPADAPPVEDAGDIDAHTPQHKVLRLGYFPREGLNPYLSANQYLRQAASLLYQNLVDISPDMQLRYGAAASVAVEGTEVAVTLRGGLVFSDGQAAAPADLVASLSAALASEAYAARFANVAAVTETETGAQLTLIEPDPLFAYLLDVPLLKADHVASALPGAASGRFYYDEESETLRPNSRYAGALPDVEYVELVGLSGYDELLAALSGGRVDLFASESETMQASGSVALQSRYAVNHLVYLGVNGGHPLFAGQEMRQALSRLVDRQAIANESYAEQASPATGLFNPLYGLAAGGLAQTAEAVHGLGAGLEAAGYTLENGWYTGADGGRLAPRILVYTGSAGKWSAANLLAEALRGAGVDAVLDEATDFSDYTAKIAGGDFELYIGEVKLYNNMDFSQLFAAEATATAPVENGPLAEAWAAYRGGEADAAAVESAFAGELPFIPLVWRTGTVYHTKRVTGFIPSLSDMLYEADHIAFSA